MCRYRRRDQTDSENAVGRHRIPKTDNSFCAGLSREFAACSMRFALSAQFDRGMLFRSPGENTMRPSPGMFVTAVTALWAGTFATSAWAQGLGNVHFETSCTPQAQEKFDRGLAMVHSFFYPDSVKAFTEAAAADPQCAIAYWGIAVSHRPNPLVVPHPASVLKNGLDAVEKGKAIGAKTER